MQITISGHQIEITAPLRAYVEDKLERVGRHIDNVTATSVVLHVEKERHIAEATINAKGATMHANAEAADMYAAIDALAGKLDRQVLKQKGKGSDQKRRANGLKR